MTSFPKLLSHKQMRNKPESKLNQHIECLTICIQSHPIQLHARSFPVNSADISKPHDSENQIAQ